MQASYKSAKLLARSAPDVILQFRLHRNRFGIPSSPGQIEPLIYLIAVGIFEAISVLWNPIIGNVFHALLMLWLVYRGSTHSDRDVGKLLLCISVCPMIRLVSLAISPSLFQGVWYYVIPEAIVLIAAIFATIVNKFSISDVGLAVDRLLWTIPLVLLSGILVGWTESHIVSAPPLATGISLNQSWFLILMLVIFTGFTEEFIFRGLLQQAASSVYNPWITITFTAFLWTSLHIGWFSWCEMGFVFGVGLFWGTLRHFNRSIITLALAHGIANVMLFVVVPHLK